MKTGKIRAYESDIEAIEKLRAKFGCRTTADAVKRIVEEVKRKGGSK